MNTFDFTVNLTKRILPEEHSADEIKEYFKNHSFQKTSADTYKITPVPRKEVAGELSSASKQNGLNALNFVRFVAGIDHDVELDEGSYEEAAQKGATINNYNGSLSHYPVKPSWMSEEYYVTGKNGTSKSNIGMGYKNIADSIVSGYMDDGDSSNIDSVGHRRWCLNPVMGVTAFGESGSYSCLYAMDTSNKDALNYDYVTWPARVHPIEYFSGPFSISLSNTNYRAPEAKNISITMDVNGKVYTFSEADTNISGKYFKVNNNGYGMKYCIIFKPGCSFKKGDKVEVTIHGLVDKNGEDATINYDVEFFAMSTSSSNGTGKSSGGSSSGGGGFSGGAGGGAGGSGILKVAATTGMSTYSPYWYADSNGVWRIKNKSGANIVSAWLCDDAVAGNGQNIWYLMNTDGTMMAAGLVQDNTGNFYSLETTHNGYYGMLRYKDGYYDCNGTQVYLQFEQSHNGSFASIRNADAIEKLKAIYGITTFPIGNESCVYSSSF